MRNSALGYFGAMCTLKTALYTARSETDWRAKARDLIYVHSNLRLLDKISDVNFTETTVQWEQWAIADSESEAEQDENNDSA